MGYNPTIPPQDQSRLGEYIYDELLQISSVIRMIEEGRILPVLHVVPGKAREGMLAVADGTDWNPGSGKGLYEYRNGAWAKL
jgi:hypothetical protein